MKLIKINTDHYVVVDDSEIQEGDWYIDDTNRIRQAVMGDGLYWAVRNGYKKITHSTEPLGFLNEYGSTADLKCDWTNVKFLPISEVKELIGEVDIHLKAMSKYSLGEINNEHDFTLGYNQALEDNKEKKYTEEDIRKAIEMARDIKDDSAHDIFTAEDISGCAEVCTYGWRNRYKDEEIIQSLQPKTEWEVEIIDGKLKLNK